MAPSHSTWPPCVALWAVLVCLLVAGCRDHEPAVTPRSEAAAAARMADGARPAPVERPRTTSTTAATKAAKSGDLVYTKAGAAETKIAARFCGLPVEEVEVMKIEPPKRIPSSAGQKPPLVRRYPQEYSVKYKEEADGGQTTAAVRLDMARGVVTYADFRYPDYERDFARERSLTKAELEKAAVSFRSRHADDPTLDARIVRSEPFGDARYDVEWESTSKIEGRPQSRQLLTLHAATGRAETYMLMTDLTYLAKAKITRNQAIERAKAGFMSRYVKRDRHPRTWRPEYDMSDTCPETWRPEIRAVGARLVDNSLWTVPGYPVWEVRLRIDSTEAIARNPRLGSLINARVWGHISLVDAVDGKVLRG